MNEAPLKTFQFNPITREQIRDYAVASGDWNKIHHDETFAKESGLPGIIAHGMLSMGLLGRAFKEWGYNVESLGFFDSKFRAIVLPGDQLTAQLLSEKKLENGLELKASIVNQKGEEVLTGSASILVTGSS